MHARCVRVHVHTCLCGVHARVFLCGVHARACLCMCVLACMCVHACIDTCVYLTYSVWLGCICCNSVISESVGIL